MKICLLLVFSLMISWEALAQRKKMAKESEAPSQAGIVVGSISLENIQKSVSNHTFYFTGQVVDSILKKYESKKGRHQAILNSFSVDVVYWQKDFIAEGKRFYLFRIEKPIGKYKFHRLQLFLNTGAMISTREIVLEFPFEIEENKTKYIGELNFNVKDANVQLRDNFKIDSAQLIKKFPDLNLNNAR